jgi:hypothetical protein
VNREDSATDGLFLRGGAFTAIRVVYADREQRFVPDRPTRN